MTLPPLPPPSAGAWRRRRFNGAVAGGLAARVPLNCMGSLGALAGCASEATVDGASPTAGAPGAIPLITPWLTIQGGWRADSPPGALLPGVTQPPRPLPVPTTGARVQLLQPVAVAAAGDTVMIADAGARVVWRYQRSRDTLESFVPLGAFAASAGGPGVALQLLADQGLLITLAAAGEVQQVDLRGRLVRRWRDERLAARPIAAVLPGDRGELLVADASTGQLVRFSAQGLALGQIGGGQLPLQSLAGLAIGPAGLYLLDRRARQVLVLDPQGEPRARFGEGVLVQPRAMAVDAVGRVVVADDADQALQVFERGEPLARFAGSGAGRFGRIESLAIDGTQLYVADSLKARVQVLLLAAPSLLRAPPEARP